MFYALPCLTLLEFGLVFGIVYYSLLLVGTIFSKFIPPLVIPYLILYYTNINIYPLWGIGNLLSGLVGSVISSFLLTKSSPISSNILVKELLGFILHKEK
jgi:hypothetical protein